MFCPLCKAEYRQGFTRCADCDVDLVPVLPPEPDPPEPAPDDAGPDSVVLCQEDDPATLTAIVSALQEAGIRYNDYPIHNPEAGLGRAFPLKVSVGQLYEIRVAPSDLSAAQDILKDVLDKGSELSAADELEDSCVEGSAPDDLGADEPLGDSATLALVWSGEEGSIEGFITVALRENGIPTRREASEDDPPHIRLLVPPEKLPRAKEIVREVVEGAPPG
jgi:hypothetical protein